MTFWDESAARISSSLSGMGTPKMTPLEVFLVVLWIREGLRDRLRALLLNL